MHPVKELLSSIYLAPPSLQLGEGWEEVLCLPGGLLPGLGAGAGGAGGRGQEGGRGQVTGAGPLLHPVPQVGQGLQLGPGQGGQGGGDAGGSGAGCKV